MEPTCRTCKRPLPERAAERGRPYCSKPCYYESLRGPRKDSVTYRTRTAKGHPIAPDSGVVAVARLVLWNKIGPGPHPCNWCGMEVNWTPGNAYAPNTLIADHVDWDVTNDDPSNLVPSCNPCNAHRRSKDNGAGGRIGADEPTILMNGKLTRAIERSCEHCGSPFLALPAKVKQGRGRFCSRSCARSKPHVDPPRWDPWSE